MRLLPTTLEKLQTERGSCVEVAAMRRVPEFLPSPKQRQIERFVLWGVLDKSGSNEVVPWDVVFSQESSPCCSFYAATR